LNSSSQLRHLRSQAAATDLTDLTDPTDGSNQTRRPAQFLGLGGRPRPPGTDGAIGNFRLLAGSTFDSGQVVP
jgi:hypothetical protein